MYLAYCTYCARQKYPVWCSANFLWTDHLCWAASPADRLLHRSLLKAAVLCKNYSSSIHQLVNSSGYKTRPVPKSHLTEKSQSAFLSVLIRSAALTAQSSPSAKVPNGKVHYSNPFKTRVLFHKSNLRNAKITKKRASRRHAGCNFHQLGHFLKHLCQLHFLCFLLFNRGQMKKDVRWQKVSHLSH